jgi:hypothetical protein
MSVRPEIAPGGAAQLEPPCLFRRQFGHTHHESYSSAEVTAMRLTLFSIALVVVLALAISLIPRSSHSEEPIKMTLTLAGKMKEGTDWVDTKILCDSHGNEIVVVKNREQGLGSTNMQLGVVAIPGGCGK